MNEIAPETTPLIRVTPRPGVLLCSPIEDPGEEAFIKVIGGKMNLAPFVVEASGSAAIQCGDVVYARHADGLSVALDLGVPYATFLEHQVYLTLTPTEPVARKYKTPQALKAALDKKAGEQAAAEKARQIAGDN